MQQCVTSVEVPVDSSATGCIPKVDPAYIIIIIVVLLDTVGRAAASLQCSSSGKVTLVFSSYSGPAMTTFLFACVRVRVFLCVFSAVRGRKVLCLTSRFLPSFSAVNYR